MGKSKFFKGIVLGAMVGGALTLLDKNVRKEMVRYGKNAGRQIKNAVINPTETIDAIHGKVTVFRQSLADLNEDVQFIIEKANEMKKLSKETIHVLSEAKDSSTGEEAQIQNTKNGETY